MNGVARSSFKKILFLGAGFLAVGVMVVLGSNWHAIAALYRPTPSPKPVLLNYTNRIHGFSLKFPQYWADSEPNTLRETASYIVRFTSPEIEGLTLPFSITIMAKDLPPELENETLQSYVEKAALALEVSANNYSLVSITDSTVSGLPAKIVSWKMGDVDNNLITDQAIFMKGQRVYIITSSIKEEFHDKAVYPFGLINSTLKFKSTGAPVDTPASSP